MLVIILRIVGHILLWGGVALVLVSYGAIWYTDGFGRLVDVVNPWNAWNLIAVAATLAPGALCLFLADKHAKRGSRNATRL